MWGCQSHEDVIEEDLGADVDEMDSCEGDFEDEYRPYGVEEDLEGAEEGLAEDRIEEEGLEGRWEVGI